MTKGTDVTRFWYGVGGDRYKRQDITAAGTKTTINVGNLEIETLNGVPTTKRTVAGVLLEVTTGTRGGGGVGLPPTAPTFSASAAPSGPVVTNKYLHYDQLGNVVRITNANGVVLEKLDFDAFGARRNVIDPRQTFISAGNVSNGTVTLPGNQILTLYATKRGFTGHEMVDGFDIVHMNGRIYDNMLGRFLQADPIVQDPSNTQNFNRYTYVWNNPLAYTDPSGMFSVKNFLNTAAQIVGFVAMCIPGLQWVGWLAYGLNVASALASGGLKAGLLSAFTSLIKLPGGAFAKAAQSVLIAGVSSVVMGGKFGAGLVGGLKSAAMGFVMKNIAADVVSAQTGGKMSTRKSESGDVKNYEFSSPAGSESKVHLNTPEERLEFKYLKDTLENGKFQTEAQATDAFAALGVNFTEKFGVEVGANLVPYIGKGAKYTFADVSKGDPTGVNVPENAYTVAHYHTHPPGPVPGFSGGVRFVNGTLERYPGDMDTNFRSGVRGYVFRAGDRAGWFYDNDAFYASYKSSLVTGKDTYSEWYVRKIK